MNKQDALNILNVAHGNNITLDACRQAYRRASMQYHPDRNPNGEELMKAVNAAWDYLQKQDFQNFSQPEDQVQDFGEKLNDAINAVSHCADIIIEVCGSWIWVSGNTYPHKDVLKAAGYKFAAKKKMWYFNPSEQPRRRHREFHINDIRNNYGSVKVTGSNKTYLTD